MYACHGLKHGMDMIVELQVVDILEPVLLGRLDQSGETASIAGVLLSCVILASCVKSFPSMEECSSAADRRDRNGWPHCSRARLANHCA